MLIATLVTSAATLVSEKPTAIEQVWRVVEGVGAFLVVALALAFVVLGPPATQGRDGEVDDDRAAAGPASPHANRHRTWSRRMRRPRRP